MKRTGTIIAAAILLVAVTSLYYVSCGGGGGGVDTDGQQPPPGGSGTGADGVKIFWYSYDSNIAFGQGDSVRETATTVSLWLDLSHRISPVPTSSS